MTENASPMKRQRLVIYIDPAELKRLKRERYEHDKPLGHIVEERLRHSFAERPNLREIPEPVGSAQSV